MEIDDYSLDKLLGKGSFGEVYLTSRKGTKTKFATKLMDKRKVLREDVKKYFNNEIFILKHISHPHIIKFYDLKQTKDKFYLITELCNGGGLSDCLEKYLHRYKRPFSQEIVQYLMRQIVSGIDYLHGNKIIHRDLKLDNILVNFDTEDSKRAVDMFHSKVKIIDFGFARYLTRSKVAQSVLGSPVNMEPHILEKYQGDSSFKLAYDSKADIYSLGTLCYEMFMGVPPFDGGNCEELAKKVKKGEYNIPTSLKLSKEAISFLNGMMQYDPEKRLDIKDLINHDFLVKDAREFTQIDLNKIEKKNQDNLVFNIKKDNIEESKNDKYNNNIWNLYGSNADIRLDQIDARMIGKNNNNKNNYYGIQDQPVDYLGNMENVYKPHVGNFEKIPNPNNYYKNNNNFYPNNPNNMNNNLYRRNTHDFQNIQNFQIDPRPITARGRRKSQDEGYHNNYYDYNNNYDLNRTFDQNNHPEGNINHNYNYNERPKKFVGHDIIGDYNNQQYFYNKDNNYEYEYNQNNPNQIKYYDPNRKVPEGMMANNYNRNLDENKQRKIPKPLEANNNYKNNPNSPNVKYYPKEEYKNENFRHNNNDLNNKMNNLNIQDKKINAAMNNNSPINIKQRNENNKNMDNIQKKEKTINIQANVAKDANLNYNRGNAGINNIQNNNINKPNNINTQNMNINNNYNNNLQGTKNMQNNANNININNNNKNNIVNKEEQIKKDKAKFEYILNECFFKVNNDCFSVDTTFVPIIFGVEPSVKEDIDDIRGRRIVK